MAASLGAAKLQDLGIVPLKQALDDEALGAAQWVRVNGIDPKAPGKNFWCTLRGKSVSRSAAYRHLDSPKAEWAKQIASDPNSLPEALDAKYGM